MNQKQHAVFRPRWTIPGLLALASTASAATIFTYGEADLFLTFRKVTPYTESYEVVVDIGQASNYLYAPLGSTNTVSGYSIAQLTGSFQNLDNLSWAVVGYTLYPPSSYTNYPPTTLWLTVPRADITVRSSDALRHSSAEQYNVTSAIDNIPAQTQAISSSIGTAGTYNTATYVREAIATYPSQVLTKWIGGLANPATGSLNDTWVDNNLENATYDLFTGSGDVVRSDFYEIRPLDDGSGHTIVDPHTGTTGKAWYVGYFEFRSDGSTVFVREAASTVVPPPPPPTVTIGRTGVVSTISFVSSNSSTYKLYFTNSAGLKAPVSTWPSLPGTLTGNGSIQSFHDTTTDSNRFYRVQGH